MLCFHLRRNLRYYVTHLIFYSLRTCMLNRMFFRQTIVSQLSHSQQLSFQPNRDARSSEAVQVQNSIPSFFSGLLLRRTARHPLEFPRVFPRHARLVSGAFAAFPEAVAFLADEAGVADAAVFGAVVLFSGACEDILVSSLMLFRRRVFSGKKVWRSGGFFLVG
jgi:hypothetical protein